MSWLGAVALAAGCASRGQLDLLESRLRREEDSVAQLRTQLSTSQSELQATRREALDLKTQLAAGASHSRAEQESALGLVEGIALNKFLTGGLDRDGRPGDELLSAVIVPTDSQGNLVKVPGSVAVTVLDLSQPAAQQRVGYWEYSPKESATLWYSGFLGSGYIVRVPWQTLPHTPTLLVHARLKTVDGRQFDTSQSIHITLPASLEISPADTAAAHQPPGDSPFAQSGTGNAKAASGDAKAGSSPDRDGPAQSPFADTVGHVTTDGDSTKR